MAKKKEPKNMVYFVLYVVLLTELLVVITERDELHEKEIEVKKKMLSSIADSYNQKFMLYIPQKQSEISPKSEEPATITMNTTGLVSREEKENIEFFVEWDPSSKNKPKDWPVDGLTNFSPEQEFYEVVVKDGNGTFYLDPAIGVGEYKFSVYARAERVFPQYLPHFLLEELEHMVDMKVVESDKEFFQITVKREGEIARKRISTVF